ncbi:MAG: class I SAM-dependent methyltransferase [Daejeonella sp.]|uniref:class I SAM-dependent methyltransferase n=1 Tax=Daejeonella sp. TaxID=2805397 RepID=UPI003C754D52
MKRLFGRFYPTALISTIKNYWILSVEFGQFKTMSRGCIDKNDEFIPWYTYPAIEYIKQIDFSDKSIFEFGSGNSTIFWAKRCKKAVSIEDNKDWYEKVTPSLPANVEYKLVPEKTDYVNSINQFAEGFDIIIIDGNHRYECTVEALKKLNSDGIIILDNSDWHENSAKLLREADLIEVDMSGFGPINGYTWTTSFFLSRSVRLKPGGPRQPLNGTGGIKI